jgi:FdhD protein
MSRNHLSATKIGDIHSFSKKESQMPPFQNIDIIHLHKKGMTRKEMPVSTESQLTICINNDLFDQMMQTPGDEHALITGLLFNDRLISSFDDMKNYSLTASEGHDTVSIQIQGKQADFSDNNMQAKNQAHAKKLSLTDIDDSFNALSTYQPVRAITRSTHAAILFDRFFHPIAAKEDVGRHNALDKVIGQALMDETLSNAYILVLSSRVSHELISKVINTPVKCILSVSRPTSLAVEIARKEDISLACLSKNDGVLIFSGADRFDIS